ncbi:MAG TPA: calcium/proton exchanger, partial [Burkholderiales bacterium]|nr:calcium/proton exchanger [Burkholderiales bacterium]
LMPRRFDADQAGTCGLAVYCPRHMKRILQELRHKPILWLLVLAPAVIVVEHAAPKAHTLLFVLSVVAIVPLAALLSSATESVAAKTGDTVGGLLNASLGNLTELVIALTALRAGMFDLVKSSIAGAIVANLLFMLGISFLVGGLRHHVQEYNAATARLQIAMVLLATVTLLVPSALSGGEQFEGSTFLQDLSLGLSILLIVIYALGLLFSLGTHREVFGSKAHEAGDDKPWPLPVALVMLTVATIFIALVSEVFVGSVEHAALQFGMSPAFVGFVVVAIVGGAAESFTAITAASKDRLDLSVGIAFGSAAQIALFVAPVLTLASYFIGPAPMDLSFTRGQVSAVFIAMLTAALVANSGKSAWFTGTQMIGVYMVFAITLYLLPT